MTNTKKQQHTNATTLSPQTIHSYSSAGILEQPSTTSPISLTLPPHSPPPPRPPPPPPPPSAKKLTPKIKKGIISIIFNFPVLVPSQSYPPRPFVPRKATYIITLLKPTSHFPFFIEAKSTTPDKSGSINNPTNTGSGATKKRAGSFLQELAQRQQSSTEARLSAIEEAAKLKSVKNTDTPNDR